jgi:hypothetical protein
VQPGDDVLVLLVTADSRPRDLPCWRVVDALSDA